MRPPTKKRKIAAPAQPEEISFNPDSRAEFLTGFHKRKIRQERKAEFEEALKRHRAEMEALNGFPATEEESGSGSEQDRDDDEEEEWGGIVEPPPVDYEAEYIDEDKYTTVTVEEIEATREGLVPRREMNDKKDDEYEDSGDGEEEEEEEEEGDKEKNDGMSKKKKIWMKDNPNKDVKKKRKRKRDFKYESPLERKLNRAKERGRKKKQAEARKAKKR
ncbi:hypothetical protein H112_06907 [Trichophyton rubrum D6]|uniref:Protein required for cell viability Rrp17 n=4 Tax=Trichophyton TaxID=5550 RepID=A0A178F2P7_TRIRU|nr:uncharacterized protein TERG_02253 [Trichophyton rubrum CBS 118892]EZF11987.1 hypothetical protein H100_06930 [Trichophyton rubrum MR850]EZF38934.1 hypothetical protein H102_06892 [Trichophyton rubrum CBS 100081]EZF49533.1 hypothetical protein H103_06915 [Trichophyton rubrum CBS 288.86]EZF60160.1 hypothetical protein H104_06870 [Trichophyton rubrum CBS 289.86]EZF70791.1 hypothetical protein H105_06930 [Trichophyton soudanense CBS 452.61]EZF81492.1 hypothetical protein H110_06911 [Trichophy